jgi:G:T-mismatch repair DNA endonuclease (very short patch repair protein)
MRKKMQETCVNVYGVDDPNRSQRVKDKIVKTCEEKYGHRSYLGSQSYLNVMEKLLSDHGVSNISQVPEVQQKIQLTMLKRYGTIHPTQSGEIKEKIRNNCQEKFGVRWPSLKPDVVKRIIEKMSTPEFKLKRHNSLKRSGFYRRQTSSGEEKLYSLLVEMFPFTQRHVNIEKWNIDFYIPEIDCFVNYNGVYWHGKNFSDDQLVSSATKQSKTILETKRRDREREAWFKESGKNLIVVWGDEFVGKSTLDTWFASDPAIRKQKILGASEETEEQNT